MYVLRVEVTLDPRDCPDDAAARQAALDTFAEMNMGRIERLPEGVKVVFQKRSSNAPPRRIDL